MTRDHPPFRPLEEICLRPPAGNPLREPPEPYAGDKLRDAMKEMFGRMNEANLRMCDGLRLMHDEHLYRDLGYATFADFVNGEFRLGLARALGEVRLSQSLTELRALRARLIAGDLSWKAAAAVARVATPETESAWLALVGRMSDEDLAEEARKARRLGRSAPSVD